MSRLELEYDEAGDKFCFFVLGFYIFGLLPLTYVIWPGFSKLKYKKTISSKHPEDNIDFKPCRSKRLNIEENKKERTTLRLVILACLWTGLLMLVFWTRNVQSNTNSTSVGYDPFDILQIDPGASLNEIKAAYKKLAMVHHPDRGGDENKFKDVAKAYKTLTDAETRSNWEKYGNPDGPGLIRFGIALPRWIIEGRNGAVLIAIYGLIFIIGLPIAVGSWWYSSIKYTADKILVDTTHLFSMFLIKTPSMNVGKALLILSGSLEFEHSHNNRIVERYSDNDELPILMKRLSVNLQERTKEKPFNFPYSLKSRILIYSYLCRESLPSIGLEQDMNYIISLCPMLLCEMAQISLQLMVLVKLNELSRAPSLETFEMLIHACSLVVQALEERKPSLYQLPHIDEKLRRIPNCSIRQLASLSSEERQMSLKGLSQSDIDDIEKVLSSMPLITINTHIGVIDDEKNKDKITVNSLITATITVNRSTLLPSQDQSTRVFCPYFPVVKYEQWWIYIVDKKQRELVASVKQPVQVDNGQIQVQLKFAAPAKSGTYHYQIWARCDSYIDLDTFEVVRFEVGPAITEDLTEPSDNNTETSEDSDVDNEVIDNEYMTESDDN